MKTGDCNLVLSNAAFLENNASIVGGGFFAYNTNTKLRNAIFTGNYAPKGSAIRTDHPSWGLPVFDNLSLYGNLVPAGGSLIYNNRDNGDSRNALYTNCVIWGNDTYGSAPVFANEQGVPTVQNSLVQGSGGSSNWLMTAATDGGGNLDLHPGFLSPLNPLGRDGQFPTKDDGLMLLPGSPAINAGVVREFDQDVLGRDRKFGIAVDMGAYERLPTDPVGPFSLSITNDTVTENQAAGTVVGNLRALNLSKEVKSIIAADGKGYAVMKDGTMLSWGGNWSGALGDGTEVQRNLPGPVLGLTGVRKASSVSGFCLALREDGTVWAWGNNSHGQLGDTTTVNRSMAAPVDGLSGVVEVGTGPAHSLVLKEDGTVWAWGKNDFGQLGDGSTQDRSAPVQVNGLSGVVKIFGGRDQSFSLALTDLGEVWAWGQNQHGQLGDGTPTPSSVPTKVSNLSGVTDIAAGAGMSLALKSDGTIWWWGRDTVNANVYEPTQVSGIDQVAQLSAGRYQAMAIRSDGSLWTWGYNGHGALGDGTSVDRSTPVQVQGLSNVIMADGAYRHSLALLADGTVWAWGSDNNYGAFGNGTSSGSSVPVQTTIGGTLANATLSYSLVDGPGSSDNNLFTLETNGTLKTAVTSITNRMHRPIRSGWKQRMNIMPPWKETSR